MVIWTCFVGSLPSLAAGVVCGSLMGFGAYQTTQDPNNVYLSLGKYHCTVVRPLK